MFVIEAVRKRDEDFVPPVIASLIAAKQKNRGTKRVECIEDAVWAALMLRPEFPHVTMTGSRHSRGVRKAKRDAEAPKEFDVGSNGVLFCSGE